MFRFANPEYLYLLLAVPALFVLWLINNYRKKKAISRFGESSLVHQLLPEMSKIKPAVKIVLQLFVLIIMALILSRPQFGSKIEEVKRQGVEVIIALDVSNSMLAEDIQPNRLERAKQALSRLVETLDNDKIGLIVFAGDAYIQLPITTDYVSAKMFLSTISPALVPKQGTAIGSAISLGMRSFSPGQDKSRAMIIITDGENHEDDPVATAKEAAETGIVIHTIGIGSPEGVPILLNTNGRREYMKDHEGNTVITKLNENILKEIALTSNGKYVKATPTNLGIEQIFSEIRKMKKQELEGTMYTEYDDQFQFFTGISLILLLLEFLIMEKKNRKLSGLKLFKIKI
ncbi:MAG: vWA domain-containing protein [Bacteroidales bacterium]